MVARAAAASSSAILEVTDLSVTYGAIQALKGVALRLAEGEIVTLIGANGAGKTTTLRAIMGLVRSSGSISYRGESIRTRATHRLVRDGLVLVPEGRIVFANLSVQENLEMGAYSRRDRGGVARDFERVFALFPRLAERRKQTAGTLSGGEQQMLAIGRALMSEPRLLLLDEPSLGLAPILVQQVFATIKEINEQGTTILLVEQNALQALTIAHRGYVLQTGNVVLTGPAKDLIKNETVRKAYLGET